MLVVPWLACLDAACTERVPTSPSDSTSTATCSTEISPITREHGIGQESGTVNVTAPSACAWTVTSSESWLTFSPSSSAGNGIVSYSVAANESLRREGRLTIAGRSFLVVQAGTNSVRLSATSVTVSPIGQFTTITVTLGAGLAWTATSDAEWLTFTGTSNRGTAGMGTGAFGLRAETNPGTTDRSATVTVTGPINVATVTVRQTGRTPQPSPYDGRWTGSGTGTSTASTPARADLSFDVVDGVISFLAFSHTINTAPGTPQAGSCTWNSSFSTIRIVNGSILASGGREYTYTISGRFVSSGSSSGTIQVNQGTILQTAPWCPGATINWTAAKR